MKRRRCPLGKIHWENSGDRWWEERRGGGSNLVPLPTLGLELEHFLEPSNNNYKLCLEWQACQVDTPNLWKDSVTIPKAGDPERLAWKNPCFLWGSTSQMQDPKGLWRVYCTPCAKMHPEEYVPVGCYLLPALSILSVETTMEEPGICTGPSVLGRGGWSASAWWTLPFSDVHTQIKVAYEKIHNLQWLWCFEGLMHGLPGVEVKETTQPNPTKPPLVDDPAVFNCCTFWMGEHVSHSDYYPCHIWGGVSCPCHHLQCIGRWAGQSSHPLRNNWWYEESDGTGIPKMDQSAFISYGGLCGEYSLQPRRPQVAPPQP